MKIRKRMVWNIFIVFLGGMVTVWGLAQGNERAELSDEGQPTAGRRAGNPVKAEEKSINTGKKLYSEKCVACHGEQADGKGEMANVFEKKPANLTDPEGVGKQNDQQIFDTLTNGKNSMPKFGSLAVNDRWNLVNFIRSVEAKTAAPRSTESSRGPAKKN